MSGAELDQLRRSGRLDSDASKIALCEVYELPDGRVLRVYACDRIAFVDDSYRDAARWLNENKHTLDKSLTSSKISSHRARALSTVSMP